MSTVDIPTEFKTLRAQLPAQLHYPITDGSSLLKQLEAKPSYSFLGESTTAAAGVKHLKKKWFPVTNEADFEKKVSNSLAARAFKKGFQVTGHAPLKKKLS